MSEGWWYSRCFSGKLHFRWASERNFCASRGLLGRVGRRGRSGAAASGAERSGGRGRCAKKEVHRSLLRGRPARPFGRANRPPAPFARRGWRVGWDEPELRGAARRGSWRSERARHVREGGSALFSASRAGGTSLGASASHYSASRTNRTRSSASLKRSCGERRREGAGGASGRKRRPASSRVTHEAKGSTRTRE